MFLQGAGACRPRRVSPQQKVLIAVVVAAIVVVILVVVVIIVVIIVSAVRVVRQIFSTGQLSTSGRPVIYRSRYHN